MARSPHGNHVQPNVLCLGDSQPWRRFKGVLLEEHEAELREIITHGRSLVARVPAHAT